jgi:hypothetical protein
MASVSAPSAFMKLLPKWLVIIRSPARSLRRVELVEPDLLNMHAQAEKFGARFSYAEATDFEPLICSSSFC